MTYSPHPPQPPHAAARPVPHAPIGDPTLAEWWQRLLARLIDSFAISLLATPVYAAYFIWLFGRLSKSLDKVAEAPPGQVPANPFGFSFIGIFAWMFALTAAVALIGFCYDWLCHGKWGATLGKKLLKLKVVRLADRGPVGGGVAAKRAMVYPLVSIVPMIGSLFLWVDTLWIFSDQKTRQCLHDKYAGTVVMRLDPPRPAYGPPGYGPPGYGPPPAYGPPAGPASGPASGPAPAGYPPQSPPGPGAPR